MLQTGIQPVPADAESQQEKTHYTEVTVAVDKFLNTDKRTLYQELEHLAVAVRIAQPIGEVLIGDAVFRAIVLLLELHDRSRRIDA